MTTNVFALIIVLGVLIFFHELGHFLVARLCGVGVEKFSLGFGPRIFGKKIGLTDYRISAIPLGGYVKMVGEEPGAELAPEDVELSFTHKHVLKRIAIVAAGPVFNFLLAVLIFWGLFQFYGVNEVKPIVGVVQEESPAFRAGIMSGDTILQIGDEKIEEWGDLARIITASSGSPLEMTVGRDGSTKKILVTPELKPAQNEFGEEIDRYVVGIQASGDVVTHKLNPASAMVQSFKYTGMVIKLTFLSVVKIIGGSISADNIGGPIMIAQMAGDQARVGIVNLINFIAAISINLAILNFLPIPVLDGGHLMFFGIELITGKPVSTKVREVAQQFGMLALLILMVFVFYNDIARLITS